MIEVHHLEHSRSFRIVWLLEELGFDYTIIRYQRDPLTRLAPAELRKIHPLGKSPLLRHNGKVLAESGVILEYLAEVVGEMRLIPERGTDDYWACKYWLHYAEGSAMPPMVTRLIFELLPNRSPALMHPITRSISNRVLSSYLNPEIARHIAYWELSLAANAWFAGQNFSIADIQMDYVLEAADKRIGVAQANPNIRRFLKSVRERAPYSKALSAVGETEAVF